MSEPEIKDGALGPGVAFQEAFKNRATIVATVTCGDNYFAERIDHAADEVLRLIMPYEPDAVIAGPAFNSGRYGVSCGAVCKAVQEKLNIPAITGMYDENPGVDLYRKYIYIIKTENNARGMKDAVPKMVNLILKLAYKEQIGRPDEEGYIPRGLLRQQISDKTGAERVVNMVLAKLNGIPFQTELHLPRFDRARPAPAIKDMASSNLALVTDGGLVPKGNPDKVEKQIATKYGSYDIEGISTLQSQDFEVVHVGYDNSLVNEDPNRLVPLDVMRDLEREKLIGHVCNKFYATTGVATPLENSKKIAKGIIYQLKLEKVDGVILTST